MKHKLFYALIGLLNAFEAMAINNGSYYLYNKAANQYLEFGSTQGIYAVFGPHGKRVTVSAHGDAYTIDPHMITASYRLDANGCAEGNSTDFIITPTDDGYYTITTDGNSYWGYSKALKSELISGTLVALDLPATAGDAIKWQFLTKADLTTRLSSATTDNPVDATFFLDCTSFSRHDGTYTSWEHVSTTSYWGYSNYGENYSSFGFNDGTGMDVCQTVTGLPAGKYEVRCQGFYRDGNNGTSSSNYDNGKTQYNAVLYANNDETPLMSLFAEGAETNIFDANPQKHNKTYKGKYIPYAVAEEVYKNTDACIAFDHGMYRGNSVTTSIGSEGVLKIGVRKTGSVSYDWTAFDNVELYYLGLDLDENKSEALQTVEEYAILNTEGNETFALIIEEARNSIRNATNIADIENAIENVRSGYIAYQIGSEPDTEAKDITSLILSNADFNNGTASWTATTGKTDTNVATNWTSNTGTPAVLEAYAGFNKHDMGTFSLTQKVTLPKGMYRLSGYAFYRYGTSYNSDMTNTGEPISLARLTAGEHSIQVMRLGDLPVSDIITYSYANDVSDASIYFKNEYYLNTLIFNIEETQTIDIGFVGEHDRYRSWFICGPVKLERINESVLAAEQAEALAAAITKYTDIKAQYNTIAGNTATDVTFDSSETDRLINVASTPEDADNAINTLSEAFRNYMESTGKTFCFTPMIVNPGFETQSPVSWHHAIGDDIAVHSIGASGGIYYVKDFEGTYLFNSWTKSNSTAFNHYVTQTVRNLPAGSYTLQALFAGDQANADLRLTANDDNVRVECIANAATAVPASLNFTLKEPGDVRIGATSNRWFKCDNFQLHYYGNLTLLRKAAAEQWESYEPIVVQSLDRSEYDTVLSHAQNELANATTEEEIKKITQTVTEAFHTLLEGGNTATGQFDITMLIANPKFDSNANNWETTGSNVTWNGNGLCEFFNTPTASISQTLSDMPAGKYTLKAQAFYRISDFGPTAEQYENGTEELVARLCLGNSSIPVMSICEGARYHTNHPASALGLTDGRNYPNTLNGAADAFTNGQYWNIVETETTDNGDLTIGLTLQDGQENNWIAFDNFRLYYGTRKALVLTQGTTTTIPEDIHTDVILNRTFTAGQYTPLCVPFNMTTEEFEAVYCIAAINENKTATLVPVSQITAGMPYIVKTAENKSSVSAKATTVNACRPDLVPVLWEGGMLQGNYPDYDITVYLENGEIADASTLSYLVADLNNTDFTVNLENHSIRKYLSETLYTMGCASVYEKYVAAPPARRDEPHLVAIPLAADNKTDETVITYGLKKDFTDASAMTVQPGSDFGYIRNLTPGFTYYYKVENSNGQLLTQGRFATEGKLRMIHAPSISNIRDLGGWITDDNRQIRYGLIYRGGEMNAEHTATQTDINELKNLGIGAELDLRNTADRSVYTTSAMGDVEYRFSNQSWFGSDALKTDSVQIKWKDNFNFIVKNLEAGRPVYFHCIWGADRTGAMAFLLEGLLGQTVDNLYKDYELTSFTAYGTVRTKNGLDSKLSYIQTMEGATLKDKFYTYFVDCLKVSPDTIEAFRRIMLDDTGAPALLTARKKYEELKQKYQTIVEQATDHSFYSTNDADMQMENAVSATDIAQAFNLLATDLKIFMDAAGGTFDMTCLINNPSFEIASPVSWDYTTLAGDNGVRNNVNPYIVNSGEGFSGKLFNTWYSNNAYNGNFFVSQTLNHLPAGTYTLKGYFASDQTSGTIRLMAGDDTADGKCDGNAAKGFGIELTFNHIQTHPLTIGAKSERWFKADSFTLTYQSNTGTGITPPSTESAVDTSIYDLSGRHVLQLRKGIYIQNGKKLIIK